MGFVRWNGDFAELYGKWQILKTWNVRKWYCDAVFLYLVVDIEGIIDLQHTNIILILSIDFKDNYILRFIHFYSSNTPEIDKKGRGPI